MTTEEIITQTSKFIDVAKKIAEVYKNNKFPTSYETTNFLSKISENYIKITLFFQVAAENGCLRPVEYTWDITANEIDLFQK